MCPKRRAGFTCPTGFKFGRPRSKAGCPQCPTCTYVNKVYVNKVSKDKKAKSNKKKAYKEKKAKYIKKKAYKEKKAKYIKFKEKKAKHIKKKAYKEKKAKYTKTKIYKEKKAKHIINGYVKKAAAKKTPKAKRMMTGSKAAAKKEPISKPKYIKVAQGSTQLETSKHMSLEKQSEHEQEKRNHEEECKRMQLRLEHEIHLGVQHVEGTLAKGSNKRATALMHSVQNQVHIQKNNFMELCRL